MMIQAANVTRKGEHKGVEGHGGGWTLGDLRRGSERACQRLSTNFETISTFVDYTHEPMDENIERIPQSGASSAGEGT